MAMTRDETIKHFMKAIEELRVSVDTETFNTAMQGFSDHMMGRPVGLATDEEKRNDISANSFSSRDSSSYMDDPYFDKGKQNR